MQVGKNSFETMKRKTVIFPFLLLGVATLLSGCYNQDIAFDDYDSKTIYFPYQYPVRTLSLGNDLIDNSLDREHKFHIGICVGGYYQTNKQNWQVEFEVDNSLVTDNLYNSAGDKLTVMPTSYYTLSPTAKVTIPKGSFSGLVEVRMSDEFFDDPAAVAGNYVIPLKIKSVQSPAQTISGVAASNLDHEADRHVATDWSIVPMDYTLFGVKFVNKYHGSWLRRGALTVRNSAGEVVDTYIYRAQYVEFDEVVTLKTTTLNSFYTKLNIKGEECRLNVSDDGQGDLSVASSADSQVRITFGSGSFKENGDAWGGTPEKPTKRDAIYLDYFYNRADGNVCEVLDTLVFRDRGITIETERPTVK